MVNIAVNVSTPTSSRGADSFATPPGLLQPAYSAKYQGKASSGKDLKAPPGLPHPVEFVPSRFADSFASHSSLCTPPPGLLAARKIREVWSWNFQEELMAFVTVAKHAGPYALIAFDAEFPGFLKGDTDPADDHAQYKMLRENVELLRPIQIGFAVAAKDGTVHGVWNFNLSFNVQTDLHMQDSLQFLLAAGIDFPRHASDGIDPHTLGRELLLSPLLESSSSSPLWITFSGLFDWGYFVDILSDKPSLPVTLEAYSAALAKNCPERFDLRSILPMGSLDSLIRMHRIDRSGSAHTAGSDALATLELYVHQKRMTVVSSPPGLGDADTDGTSSVSMATKPSWGASARTAMLGALAPWRKAGSHIAKQRPSATGGA